MGENLSKKVFEDCYNYAKRSSEMEGIFEDNKTRTFVYSVMMEGKNPDEEFKKLYGI